MSRSFEKKKELQLLMHVKKFYESYRKQKKIRVDKGKEVVEKVI